jgi:SEC-C motif-containing protein
MPVACPCGSNVNYADCCETYHLNKKLPATPEYLMRSRYSAYVLQLIDYLIETTHPKTRHLYDKKGIAKWAKSNTWLKLEICLIAKNNVEFKAHYKNGDKVFIHHEDSKFEFENGRWYYVDGRYFN